MNKNVKGIIRAIIVSILVWAILFSTLYWGKPKTLYLPKTKLEKFKDLNATTISVVIALMIFVIMLGRVYVNKNKM
jgi:membrane protein involved in colicin uptake